jgi:hypothetical protein
MSTAPGTATSTNLVPIAFDTGTGLLQEGAVTVPFLKSAGVLGSALDTQSQAALQVSGVPVTTLSDSQTSGVINLGVLSVSVAPTGPSTRQVFGQQTIMTYNSTFSVSGAGYTCTQQNNLILGNIGTHAKAVNSLVQVSAIGGNVTNLLGFESEPLAIGASTTITNYAAFYTSNVAGVANIGNIQLYYAFANDHVGAPGNLVGQPSIIKHQGIYCNGALNELSPSQHPGLVASRYYSAPCSATSPVAVAANTLYFVPVLIPHRCNITKLGVNVTTGAAGNVVLGLYRSGQSAFPGQVNGVPTTLVAQTTAQSTAGVAQLEAAIAIPSSYLDAGLYFIAALFSGAPTVTQHSIDNSRIAMYGGTAPTDVSLAMYAPLAYTATLPATIGAGNVSYLNQASEPRLWFRL